MILLVVSDITRWNIALMSCKVIDKAMLRALFDRVSPPVTSAGAYMVGDMQWDGTCAIRTVPAYFSTTEYSAVSSIERNRPQARRIISATFLANSETDFEFVRLLHKLLEIGDTNGGVVSDKAAANRCK